ncbi:alkaline phosphatase PafA [Mucilaginibacter myungsuensis]|uniref:Alkaline phosphatase family protein n=1 Tax=Mucilaginibacter myungsuensis TaxID=649104 RepID=A0A929KYA8_9SPHI|nr:alkaline phosphatase PafA [Mucilaginibacter myungsuensis]MBE9662153.1 alkaline phosphatase family protein [Mucilaginibacter myungsuensis]MDN3599413.1 alkaline phosphatase family protein [Mucilaginibacter myungsuensis]
MTFKISTPIKMIALASLQLVATLTFAQTKAPVKTVTLPRPKLVVGLVIDQMRWDYLYRYYDRYAEGGFKRLLNEGFKCENHYINYLPSATAVGHASIFTGSVPAINGIAGNDWVDQATGRGVYCVSDSTVGTIGAAGNGGKMSPRSLLSSTMTDELRLATNNRSKVVGISLKDRASILPAGHNPTGAFWFDDASSRFITSNYYMTELPAWVNDFNSQNNAEKLLANGWNTLYPIDTYKQSTADNVVWEGKFRGETTTAFPHNVNEIFKTNKGVIRTTPFGNTLTLDFAKAAIDAYKLGTSGDTDFLTINCASTDYVGHMYGPNAIEVEDTYLRLDRDLAAFFKNLDDKLGKGTYTVFLSADHGASHSYKFNLENKIPAGYWHTSDFVRNLNQKLKSEFGEDRLVLSITEFQVNFNRNLIKKAKISYDAVKYRSIEILKEDPQSLFVVDMDNLAAATVPAVLKEKIVNAFNYKRSGSVMVVPTAGWIENGGTGTTHGEWNAYDTHLPLIFMGWGVQPGVTYDNTNHTDIAPTIASLLHIQTPSGNIGSVIPGVIKGSPAVAAPAKQSRK